MVDHNADVVLVFSPPDVAHEQVQWCIKQGKHVVVGTSGSDERSRSRRSRLRPSPDATYRGPHGVRGGRIEGVSVHSVLDRGFMSSQEVLSSRRVTAPSTSSPPASSSPTSSNPMASHSSAPTAKAARYRSGRPQTATPQAAPTACSVTTTRL
ncbi:hypothetical protein OTC26_026375 [Streptomyces tirandamycinicus]|uniref:hypothetical protein n=1 Tax=Streptomyces tirandamycinicus TaxID=2174846 RepID=UPI0039842B40